MRVLLTKQEMQALDRLAIEEIGIPSLVLMETAGLAVADVVERVFRERASGPILAIAGLGNNGGDAVVAARHLADRGLPVSLALAGDPARASADLAHQLAVASRLGLEAIVLEEGSDLATLFDDSAVAIDGLFGTGLSRNVEGFAARVIDALAAAELAVVAVDVPSGIDATTGRVLGRAVRADATVTFQHAKFGHVLYPGRAHTGELIIADIGIPRRLLPVLSPKAEVVGDDALALALPARHSDTHKGTYGHLLVVAGVPERPGAALLVGRAALRVGAGLVTLGSDEETIRRLAPAFDELMGLSLGRDALDADRLLEALQSRTALAIGPSLAPDAHTKALVLDVLMHAVVPVVVDAGALSALGADVPRLAARKAPTILTPHPGEMAKLSGLATADVQADRVAVSRRVAEASGAYVVLKGASTVVASPDGRVGVLTDGNPGMATGGTGDILTGVIGGLLAQGVPPELAARAGALLHARAGDRAATRGEHRLVASDLLDELARGGGAAHG